MLPVTVSSLVVWGGEVSCGNIVAEYRYRGWIGYGVPELLSYPELRFLSTSVFPVQNLHHHERVR